MLFLIAILFLALPAHAGTPIVLEMSTSQGCGDTPPAEDMLYQLYLEDPDLIILNCHTTYFEEGEWSDIFAQEFCDSRHRLYYSKLDLDQIQTPEIIINGRHRAETHDINILREQIAAARTLDNFHSLTLRKTEDTLEISFPAFSPREPLDIWLFGTHGPQKIAVSAGPNAGKTLSHFNTVSVMAEMGVWDGKAETLAYDIGTLDADTLTVILQEREQGAILAAGKIKN